MPEITAYENENAFLDFTLKYGPLYSNTSKRGLAVPQGDTTDVFFYASATSGGVNWLTLSASGGTITWTDATNGKIRVKLGTNTGGRVGSSQFYELRIKFADGSYVTAESGTLNILQSNVERP